MSYKILENINPEHVHVQFEGVFRQQHVIWDAHMFTLHEYWRTHYPQNTQTRTGLRNFIQIGETGSKRLNLTVGLHVPRMDEPTIQKVMIMIKQYKRLDSGKHEYGEIIQFSTTPV